MSIQSEQPRIAPSFPPSRNITGSEHKNSPKFNRNLINGFRNEYSKDTQTNRNRFVFVDQFKSIRDCYPLKSELVRQPSRAPIPGTSLFFNRSRTKERVKTVL